MKVEILISATLSVISFVRSQDNANDCSEQLRLKKQPLILANTFRNTWRVRGENAAIGEFPFMVSLWINYGAEVKLCGGSIFDESTVITAAHCVAKQDINDLSIIAGDHELGSMDGNEQCRSIVSVTINEFYDELTVDNDTAILKLDRPLVFNERVQPIKLAEFNSNPSGSCKVCGWGITATGNGNPYILQRAELDIMDREACKSVYQDYIKDGMLCAVGRHGSFGTCTGDSGGPLVCRDETGENYLAAVISWGMDHPEFPCGDYPSVFANVAHYRRWFDENLN